MLSGLHGYSRLSPVSSLHLLRKPESNIAPFSRLNLYGCGKLLVLNAKVPLFGPPLYVWFAKWFLHRWEVFTFLSTYEFWTVGCSSLFNCTLAMWGYRVRRRLLVVNRKSGGCLWNFIITIVISENRDDKHIIIWSWESLSFRIKNIKFDSGFSGSSLANWKNSWFGPYC